jgi:hypothetical protein
MANASVLDQTASPAIRVRTAGSDRVVNLTVTSGSVTEAIRVVVTTRWRMEEADGQLI